MADTVDINELGRSVDPKSLSDEQLISTLGTALRDGNAKDVDPSLFARLVKTASKQQLATVMSSEVRRPVLEAIFGRMSEFYSSKGASGNRQVVHWHIKDGSTTDSFQTVMQNGTCTVTEGTDEEARTALIMPGTEFLKVATNNANPVTLFMTRKLKVSGDVGFATALQKMFQIPSA
ncbi:SCP2 sterol-binding domain-containing protein [Pseudonocardia alni]|uniref:SCP2 sterol-binding domain-containing protein n=1 Tax=Pseudonocardia alni TaxID=33907 RepID=UPI0027A3D881|nr:SCP2 sterol-binding domain-containing protein [Pseudonocardia alni]